VFDDNIFAVVAASGNHAGVHHTAIGDAGNEIEGIAGAIAVDRLDVDAFMEFGHDDLILKSDGIADVAECSAFPRLAGFSLEGPVHIHIKSLRFVAEKVLIFGRQPEVDGGLEEANQGEREEEGKPDHGAEMVTFSFFCPRRCAAGLCRGCRYRRASLLSMRREVRRRFVDR